MAKESTWILHQCSRAWALARITAENTVAGLCRSQKYPPCEAVLCSARQFSVHSSKSTCLAPAQLGKSRRGIVASVGVAELNSTSVCHPSLRVFFRGTWDPNMCPSRQPELCTIFFFQKNFKWCLLKEWNFTLSDKRVQAFLHARFASLILDNSCMQSFYLSCKLVFLDLTNDIKVLHVQEKVPHCKIWDFLNTKIASCKGLQSGLQTSGHHCQWSSLPGLCRLRAFFFSNSSHLSKGFHSWEKGYKSRNKVSWIIYYSCSFPVNC